MDITRFIKIKYFIWALKCMILDMNMLNQYLYVEQ